MFLHWLRHFLHLCFSESSLQSSSNTTGSKKFASAPPIHSLPICWNYCFLFALRECCMWLNYSTAHWAHIIVSVPSLRLQFAGEHQLSSSSSAPSPCSHCTCTISSCCRFVFIPKYWVQEMNVSLFSLSHTPCHWKISWDCRVERNTEKEAGNKCSAFWLFYSLAQGQTRGKNLLVLFQEAKSIAKRLNYKIWTVFGQETGSL